MRSRRWLLHAGLVLHLLARVACAQVRTVAVVTTDARGPFLEASDALVKGLERSAVAIRVERYDLQGDEGRAAQIVDQVRQSDARLIVPVGSLATANVLRRPQTAPVVFSMVLYPRHIGYEPAANATGVALDVPLDVQFGVLRELLPSAHRLGVLYQRDETGPEVTAARNVAERYGFTLHTANVERPSEVPVLLPSFLAGVDAVWMVADSHVINSQTVSELILQGLRMWVPVFGLSAPQVKMGALVGFGYDYADIGAQTADIAVRVLNGEAASSIAVAPPRKLPLTLNARSARHLNVQIPAAIEQQASEVIR